MKLADLVARAPLLADGAMGTVLYGRGLASDASIERLNLTRPDEIRDVHAAYVAAGAELLCTNTFAANRLRLSAGLADQVAEINRAGVGLAREAARSGHRPVVVAGDVGPLGAHLAPYGRLQASEARAVFAEQIGALRAGGVDLLLFETFADVRELLEAIAAARALGSDVAIATMTFTRDDRTLLGETAAQVARRLVDGGADVIGVNCAGGPAQAMRLVLEMRAAAPDAVLAVKPNAGWPEHAGGRLVYPSTPEYFAEYARRFAAEGVAVIGGCCGTTPEHIAAMREALDATGREARVEVRQIPPPRADAFGSARPGVVRSPQSSLLQKLAAGKFVVTVEMSPPKGLNTQAALAGARLLKEAGADAINVADSPRARMRMSPWAVCHLLQREVGLETVLHFPLRGRNVLRVQGDLLGAHALGVRNLFAMMGDPTAIGDHPGAMDAYDLVPSGLIRLVKQRLNAGVDHTGAGIGEPTAFVVGCALNLGATDVDKEIRGLHKKLEAGADFILTQPVFDVAAARAFLHRHAALHGELDVPLIAGVLPLYGERHATFLHNEVPGIHISDDARRRVAEGGRDAGIRIALEIIAEVRSFARGVYLMPPFEKWDMAAEILESMR